MPTCFPARGLARRCGPLKPGLLPACDPPRSGAGLWHLTHTSFPLPIVTPLSTGCTTPALAKPYQPDRAHHCSSPALGNELSQCCKGKSAPEERPVSGKQRGTSRRQAREAQRSMWTREVSSLPRALDNRGVTRQTLGR